MVQKLVLVGASTGGPGHLDKLFRALPAEFAAPVVVAQHINVQFLPTLCESLSSVSRIGVRMAQEGCALERCGYLTHRDVNRFVKSPDRFMLGKSISCGDHAPNVDELFFSAVALAESGFEVMAALLTGIGSDGAEGLLALKKAGATTLAESEKTAIVYGMPRAAYELGAVDKPTDLEAIIEAIAAFGACR